MSHIHLDGKAVSEAVNRRAAMRAEAQRIAESHPDIAKNVDGFWNGTEVEPLPPVAPPVVVHLPGDVACRDVELLIRHEIGGVLVDIREKPSHAWIPLTYVGGSFEVRDQ